MSENKDLLILTVGVGTAGRDSNLVQGLRNTISLLKPRKFWLIHSEAGVSKLSAEFVAEDQPNFAACLGSIKEADNLEDCRRTIREGIETVRKELQPGERLLINATSGTKQMSAGAIIAALDKDLGDIVFTVGERQDGVVMTGTETIVSFDSSTYFQERDENKAREFFQQGDFNAAEQWLRPHGNVLTKQVACAATCKFWQQFDYENASKQAARFNQKIKNHLDKALRNLEQNLPCKAILCDILAWANFALKHQDPENAARLTYKALEYTIRLLMLQDLDMKPNKDGCYSSSYCMQLNLSASLTNRLTQQNESFSPGVANGIKLLREKGDSFPKAYNRYELGKYLKLRNQNTHAISPVSMQEAQSFYDSLIAALAEYDKLQEDSKRRLQIKPTILPDYPTVAMKHILVATTGMTPAVLTETVWALAHPRHAEYQPVLPDEIRVVTSLRGKQKLQNLILESGVWEQLRQALKAEPGQLKFTEDNITVVRDRQGQPLDGLLCEADHEAFADTIMEALWWATSQPDAVVTASLAGGFKTMAALMLSTMQILARPGDSMTHVLVSGGLEAPGQNFFFPRTEEEAGHLHLIHIPLIPLRAQLAAHFPERPQSYEQLMACCQEALSSR